MKVSNYLDTKPSEEVPGVVKREVITANDGAPHFCMRVFEVEPHCFANTGSEALRFICVVPLRA